MNDDEVLSEMKKMVSFIKQEAMEKAREIQVKADEEFAIEKVGQRKNIGVLYTICVAYMTVFVIPLLQAKIVRSEAQNIESTYEKKRKQASVSQKM
jgi:V-type H+-transporting ATPase subunit E